MKIKFLDISGGYLTEWYNYPNVPNIGDEVVLTIYPKIEPETEINFKNTQYTIIKYVVKERQWHEQNTVFLIVTKKL